MKDEDIDEFFAWMQSQKLTREELIENTMKFQMELDAALKGAK